MPTTSIWNSRWTSRNGATVWLIFASLLACTATSASTEFEEKLVLVDINHQQLNQTVIVLEDSVGGFYLPEADLQGWRLRLPDKQIDYAGERYFPLDSFLLLAQHFDPKKLILSIELQAAAFTETSAPSESVKRPKAIKSGSGGFINYELSVLRSSDSMQRSGQFELAYFNRFGVGTSTLLLNHFGAATQTIRLESTWVKDFPETLQTWRWGDATNASGSWGHSLRFGGIQLASNFAVQPGFVTLPPQSAIGQAVLPSTVDVFINNALVSRLNVPPGPFSIGNLPVVTGAGEIQLVVRDLLGREHLVSQSFYASQSLLRTGLEEYSYELGRLRENFALNSNDYGDWLSTGTYRRGITDRFTGEIHSEASRNRVTLGGGGDMLIPQLGTFKAYLAGSQNRTHHGNMIQLGIERQAQPWSLGARTQWMSAEFTQLGMVPRQPPPIKLASFNLSYAALGGGSFGVAFAMQSNRSLTNVRIATCSYTIALRKIGSLGVSAMRNFEGVVNTTVFALLSISLSPTTGLSVTSQFTQEGKRPASPTVSATLQRNLSPGEGYGYRLQTRTDKSVETSYSQQNNSGTFSIDAAQYQGEISTRVNLSGGLAFLDHAAFMSRRIDQSFAVVQVADYSNVHLLADNQPAGKTNSAGKALIPNLRAYDINVISVDQRDLPIDAEISTLKVDAVPYFRSGIEINFPIKHSQGATFTVQLENGDHLPVGTRLTEVNTNSLYTVGFGGEVYIVGLSATSRMRANWGKLSCEFTINFKSFTEVLPDLGVFICKSVKPI